MNFIDVNQQISNFLNHFPHLSEEEKLTFLHFNQFHQHRSIDEILEIYVQNPDARVLKTIGEWQQFSNDSFSDFHSKEGVKIWDNNGNLKEVLYDASQVILNTGISIPSTINDDPLLFIELASQVDKKIAEIQNISKEQKSLAKHLALYNLFDYLGIFLDKEAEYEHFISITLKSIKKIPSGERLLKVLSLANSCSSSLTYSTYPR